MNCKACRRELTDPVSIKYGYGPTCLKRAVAAGNAPLEALEELAVSQRTSVKKRDVLKQLQISSNRCTQTVDLFDHARREAIDALHKAASDCRGCGVVVSYSIGE